MRALLTLIAVVATSLASIPAMAQEVNYRNANLYVDSHDVKVQKPGVPLELQRVYNSRSNLQGHFGWGWSTNLDIVCQEGPDGSILVTDADGFIMRYTPDGEPRERLMHRYVDRLVEARRDQDARLSGARTDAFYDDLREQLRDKPEMRQEMGQVLASAWLDAVPGDYISYDRGTEHLTKKSDNSYVRHRSDGTKYYFDKRGLLTHLVDAGDRGIRLDYDRDNRLQKVTHSEGGSITLTYTNSGKISSILDTEGRAIKYSYEDDNLKMVQGPGSRKIAYAYDGEHNMTAAKLEDGSEFRVSYDAARDWVAAVKVGENVTQYSWDIQDYQHYTANVTGPGGVTKHIFDDAENRQTIVLPDGSSQETLLSACCAKPLEVREDGGITRYDYDDQARLVGIVFPDDNTVRYAYHPKWSRVVQAMHSDGRRYGYTYDEVGNLTEAVDANGRKLALNYGRNGKVDEIRDQSGQVYTFVYDASGRPTQIAKGAEGSLNIKYGMNGEIRATEVAEGTSSQSDLYSDLREVLSLLEPATGNLQ